MHCMYVNAIDISFDVYKSFEKRAISIVFNVN